MARHVDKLVVTNRAALTAKYGTVGFKRIEAALSAARDADHARGLSSRRVLLDRPPKGIATVADRSDAGATKAAVDALVGALTPLYVMILGGPDVVAQPLLRNPTNDDDASVPSDLPYACAAAPGTNPTAFVGPSRVVGRLPDALGADDPDALIHAITVAAGWKARPSAQLLPIFGISADPWKISTRLSVQHLPGAANTVHLSPPEGPVWPPRDFKARLHFVNCHGADTDPHWFGQRGSSYPVAVDADLVASAVTPGTVVAAECCYGAQHYDPSLAGGHRGVALSYLAGGAYGVFASSTLAYGPASAMGSADLLTRYFLASVLEGASLGRAALEARLRFVQEQGELDPIDLKTLVQFDLLGDPSIHPMVPPPGTSHPKAAKAVGRGGLAAPPAPGEPDRSRAVSRRATLAALGAAVDRSVARTDPRPQRAAGISLARVAGAADVATGGLGPVRTYVARPRLRGAPTVRFHVASERAGRSRRTVIVRDAGGELTSRVVFSK